MVSATLAYVKAVRGVRSVLDSVGALDRLDAHVDRRPVHWVRSQFAVYSIDDLVALDTPWWTYEAIDIVEKWLEGRDDVRVFEWGSGASTVWLQKRVSSITTVEHDRDFVSMLRPYIAPNTTLLERPGEPSVAPSVPSGKRGFEDLDFSAYVDEIDSLGGSFDLVVIDGRARSECLEKCVPRLAEDGLVVFDNSHRSRYRAAIADSGLHVRRTRGMTPASPYPTETSLLTRV